MLCSLNVSRKVYFRSIWLVVPYFALIASSIVTLTNLYKYYTTPVDYLTDSLKLGVICFCYFGFCAYELSALLRRAEGKECIASFSGANLNLSLSHIIMLTFMLTCWTLFMIVWQIVVCSIKHVLYLDYVNHCILAFILYFFMPGMVALLLGSSLWKINRPLVYLIIICATLLCSSVPIDNFSSLEINETPVAPLLDWFYISVPNSNWVADSVYGVAMEPRRWVLSVFWIVFLLSLFIFSHRKDIYKLGKTILCCTLLLAILFGVRFVQREHDFVLQKDYRPDGILRSEISYRDDFNGEVIPANFAVNEYDIALDVQDSLMATVSMSINSAEVGLFKFTLFHEYQIVSVTDENGIDLPYSRNGDYLDITSTQQISSITVKYKGNAWKYYANNQGIFLPVYAAFYPIPGHYEIWDSNQTAINTTYRSNPSIYTVNVDANVSVFSNLNQIGPNSFYGEAEGVSLIGGLITNKKQNNLTIYQSVLDDSISIDANAVNNTWTMLSTRVGESKEFDITNKCVFIQPLTATSIGNSTESVVVYEDHILLSGNQISSEVICGSYLLSLIPNIEEKAMVREIFSLYMFASAQMEVGVKPSYDSLAILKKYNHHSEITDIEEWQTFVDTANITFYELFEYQLGALGEEYVLRSVYQYLLDESDTTNQIDFIYYLGGEIDA